MLNSIAYLIIFFTLMFYIVRLTVFQGIATPMQQEPFFSKAQLIFTALEIFDKNL